MDPLSHWPNAASLPFAEAVYVRFLQDPTSVPADWRAYFESLHAGEPPGRVARLTPSFPRRSLFDPPSANGNGRAAGAAADHSTLQERVDKLVRLYRVRGHLVARIDPLGIQRPHQKELDLEFHGLSPAHLDVEFSCATSHGPRREPLRRILERVQNTYCRSIGVQFMHMDEQEPKDWLQERMEGGENRVTLARTEQLRILTRLTDAVIFEEFIQKKYLGAKSFSLEGAESLIPLLDLAIEDAGAHGVQEIVLGMAHRGRLNVLANIMAKSPRQIFREFEDKAATTANPAGNDGRSQGGDVKYHLGYSSDWTLVNGRKVHLSLCFNPSHLEYVNPVALGRMRAKMDRHGDRERARGMVVLIHGDAAFIGEGVVQETLNLSRLEAYSVGGTLHVIVNNQVGFTTSPAQARSGNYATSIARMLQVPIFHVNGEDPEAVAQVVRLAMDFRRKFRRDVVIDMYCFRRRGHNEGDEPSFTQPLMYKVIEKRPPVRESYRDQLLRLGEVTREEADEIARAHREGLEQDLSAARSDAYEARPQHREQAWRGYAGGPEPRPDATPTSVPRQRLTALLEAMTRLPEGFTPHPKIERLLAAQREMAAGKRPVDWATAELLAFATLATQGFRVRMTGQDTERGTFSQRHAVLHDHETDRVWMPLANLEPGQAPVEIWNSPLSEIGVMGFEYGYSLDWPDGLVLWEAQFGDFVNCAQVVVDQFLVSGEAKWNRLSGLVLLLPHGFEGMGPEHSSARLERFLNLSVDDNIQVCNPTTPANWFHLLRRQVLRPWRKPLIVMTPKSLLRHPKVVSDLREFAEGTFQRVIKDDTVRPADVKRVLLCSGKVYYDLLAARDEKKRNDVAIVRVEQLYPLRDEDVAAALEGIAPGVPAFWVQEEPANMGAWPSALQRWERSLLGRHPFAGISRPRSASPATGSAGRHKAEQSEIVAQALEG